MDIIDISGIEGTRCFCDAGSASQIRKLTRGHPLSGTHYLGSGDYHYLTLFQLERICEPFGLILFDNHSDSQGGAFGQELLSCGNWVLSALKLPLLKDMLHISGPENSSAALSPGLPVYISIDLDVLSTEYAQTNWDQGSMSTDKLCNILEHITEGRRIIGADFCGAPPGDAPSELNRRAIAQISKTMIL